MNEFEAVRLYLASSTCLKTQTAAGIFKDGKLARLSLGANLCAPGGGQYGRAVADCPRMQIKTGGQYELCAPVHAEVMACLNIRPEPRSQEELAKFAGHLPPVPSEVMAAFTVQELILLDDADLYLVGHYWACDNCLAFLAMVGIPKENVHFDKLTGEATKARYTDAGLTKE